MNLIVTIDSFTNEFAWLSNFYLCPTGILLKDADTGARYLYPTVEHAYQAAKTLDSDWRRVIRKSTSPGMAKAVGRLCPCQIDWNRQRLSVMRGLVREKFSYVPLQDKLLATADAILIEGNTWKDTFWGTYQGKGENQLGKILMATRSELMVRGSKPVEQQNIVPEVESTI